MASEFEKLGLAPELVQAVIGLGFEQPTPIQQSAIPALLEGRNVLGQAQTGTGKTAAFVLPLLQELLSGKEEIKKGTVQALVLAPTRELAIQVAEAAGRMAAHSPLRVVAVYGGQSYQIQLRQIQRGVEVVVGTPGRLLDLIRQGKLNLKQVRYLVLDEADEMLEMGFIEDVEAILAEVAPERQMALFSATLPEAVRKLADRYLVEPHVITISPSHVTVADTEQRFVRVREMNKLSVLMRLLESEDVKSALIFARTRARTQELADELASRGYPAESLHGDLSQARREYVLNRFRQGVVTLLVATDVAARGLDIEDMSHVFNYDAPGDPDDYVHRIGRTGRAGRKGIALSFFTSREIGKLKDIERFTRQSIQECQPPTRDEILARRDERFLQRLTEQLSKGSIGRERALLARLDGTSYDLAEIAAAAIQMARAGEGELPQEIVEPAWDSKPARANRRRYEDEPAAKGPFGRPAQDWKETRDVGAGPRLDRSERSRERAARGPRFSDSGMVRLRMNLGKHNGLRPGDVVGAIASEVGIPGRAIGEISIFPDHTFVDVAEKHVAQVLSNSSGRYFLHGKPVLLTLANS